MNLRNVQSDHRNEEHVQSLWCRGPQSERVAGVGVSAPTVTNRKAARAPKELRVPVWCTHPVWCLVSWYRHLCLGSAQFKGIFVSTLMLVAGKTLVLSLGCLLGKHEWACSFAAKVSWYYSRYVPICTIYVSSYCCICAIVPLHVWYWALAVTAPPRWVPIYSIYVSSYHYMCGAGSYQSRHLLKRTENFNVWFGLVSFDKDNSRMRWEKPIILCCMWLVWSRYCSIPLIH